MDLRWARAEGLRAAADGDVDDVMDNSFYMSKERKSDISIGACTKD